ncbi:MAG: Spy/CpxP family protein refolding chaperone [Gemmatimonadota bacterium]
MRTALILLSGLLILAGPVRAQDLQDDTGPRAGELRRQIENRFAARVQEELGLSDAQTTKMRTTVAAMFERRRTLEDDERRYRASLAGQLRPGVAANQDSVARLMDAILDVRSRYVESYRDEMKEMAAYLTPAQRAQYFILRERLLDRVRAARQDSAPGNERPRRLRP